MKAIAWRTLADKYYYALAGYVAGGTEEHLQGAYEAGRRALELGLGVLDLVRLHQESAARLLAVGRGPAGAQQSSAIESFLMEALSPFEVAHRGFRDACERLSRAKHALEERNRELARGNIRLEREILRRQNAQDALEESELKFRSVVESAQDGIITINGRGILVSLNHGAEALFGYPQAELLGKSVICLIPKPLRAAARMTLRCLIAGDQQQLLDHPIETSGLHRSGAEFPVELTVAKWRTRAGVFITGIARDIRERKQAELALTESRGHYMKLFKEARAMEENLRRLSNKVITAQEEERKHISRELHDEIGQVLTAANVSIALLRKHASRDEMVSKEVETAQRLLKDSMDMVYHFARELRPSMLDHLGPYAALQNFVKSYAARTGIKTELENHARLEQLDPQQGTVLYRVAQESLSNVYKHAHATRVKIRLLQQPTGVLMEISDNGKSFNPADTTSEGEIQRLGLLGMQERVRLVNGNFSIESKPRRGTTVRVTIPVSHSTNFPNEAGELSLQSDNNSNPRHQ